MSIKYECSVLKSQHVHLVFTKFSTVLQLYPDYTTFLVRMFLDFNTYLVRYTVALYTLLRKPNRYCYIEISGKFTSIYFSKGYSIPRLLSWMHDSNDPCAWSTSSRCKYHTYTYHTVLEYTGRCYYDVLQLYPVLNLVNTKCTCYDYSLLYSCTKQVQLQIYQRKLQGSHEYHSTQQVLPVPQTCEFSRQYCSMYSCTSSTKSV